MNERETLEVLYTRTGGLNDLEEIGLCNNQLAGPIPAWLGLCPNLRGIWASGCGLSGEIPVELAQAGSLTYLDLANNTLTGQIPEALEQMGLRTLLLEGNQFTGGIPDGLWKIAHHDLEQTASDSSQELTGHLLDFNLDEGWMTITTCPEWPARTIRMWLRNATLMRNLNVGELVGVMRSQTNDENWAENVWSMAEHTKREAKR